MATSVNLHPKSSSPSKPTFSNPLPPLVQTPAGLALLELQGTINLPEHEPESQETPRIGIGRLTFPDYNPDALDPTSTKWMKRVHMYVGQHQRLTGEVKKLPTALAVVRKRGTQADGGDGSVAAENGEEQKVKTEDLEVVDIVKHKLTFSSRPEPVGNT